MSFSYSLAQQLWGLYWILIGKVQTNWNLQEGIFVYRHCTFIYRLSSYPFRSLESCFYLNPLSAFSNWRRLIGNIIYSKSNIRERPMKYKNLKNYIIFLVEYMFASKRMSETSNPISTVLSHTENYRIIESLFADSNLK